MIFHIVMGRHIFTSLGVWFQLSKTLLQKKFLLTSSLAGLGLRLSGSPVFLGARLMFFFTCKIYFK
jgi:hypothetical protein